jgi:uncharacterized membrane protein
MHALALPAREMVLERLSRGHFPLYFLILKAAVAVAGGAGEASLRLPSVIFYALAVASFWFAATRLLAPRTAMLAVTMLALNALALRQATEARMYTLVLLLSVWATLAYLRGLGDDTRRRWKWVFFGATLASFWTSPSVAVTSWVYVMDAFRRRRQNPALLWMVLPPWVIAGLSLLPGVFVHTKTAQQGEIALTRPAFFPGHVSALFTGVPTRDDYFEFTTALTLVQCAGFLLFLAMMWRLWRTRRSLSPALSFCAQAVLLPTAVMVVTWALYKMFHFPPGLMGPARYLMPTLPCAVILGASLLEDIARDGRVPQGWMHAAMAVFLAAGSWMLLSVPTEASRFRYYMEQLRKDYKPGDGLMVTTREVADGVEYYVPGAKVDLALNRNEQNPRKLREKMAPLAERDTVWFVIYRSKYSPSINVALRLFGRFETNSSKRRMGLLRVLKFTPKDNAAARAGDTATSGSESSTE